MCIAGGTGTAPIYNLSEGGTLTLEGLYIEQSGSQAQYLDQTGSGNLTLACGKQACEALNTTPTFLLNGMSGTFTGLELDLFNDAYVGNCPSEWFQLEGSGSTLNAALFGSNFWVQGDTSSGGTVTNSFLWQDTTSPAAQAAMYLCCENGNGTGIPGGGGYYAVPNVTNQTVNSNPSNTFVLNSLAELRNIRRQLPTNRANGSTDVKIYHVMAGNAANGCIGTEIYRATQCAAPSFNPAAGSYSSAPSVTISTTTGGATISYTTDGSTPTSSHGTVYSTPVTIGSTCTLQAMAYETGYSNSTVSSGVYTINGACAAPTFNPAAGTYASAQTVTISTTTGGATIYYTTNGTTPSSTNGTVYSSPVAINSTCTLQAIAYATGYANSTVSSGVYTIGNPVTWNTDTTTEGSWWSSAGGYVYGSQGYVLCAWTANATPPTGNTSDVVSLSGSFVSSVTPSNEYTWCWANNQSDVRALINPGTGTRDASTWNTSWGAGDTTFDALVTLNNPNDGLVHSMAVYCLDWDSSGRTQTLDILNPSSGLSELSGGPVALSSFSNGTWVVFHFMGNIKLHVSNTNASANAVISAIAFDNVAPPTFNPVPGTYTSAQNVTISSSTSGATIRYTTNGTTPSSTVGTVYSSPVNISATCTLQAIAYMSGYTNSSVTSGVYTININICAAPTFNPVAGTYTSSTSVTISTTTGGASIRYTTNGTTPSSTVGTVYSSPVSISSTCTLQAIAYEAGYTNSSVSSGVYTIQCATPTFNPAAGTFTTSTSVTISTTTGGASIRYTTNGTTPSSTVGTVYSSAVSLTSTCTLQAIAYETGLSNSAVASGVYTIQCATPTFNPAAGTYTTSTSVTIATTTGGASIRYTTNGTTPSSTVGTVYSSAVSITATSTLQAIAYETGLTNSAVTSGVYTIQCATPTFNPAAGTFTTSTSVTIATTTGGASIRYTTNGTTPSSTVGTVYSSAVSITATSTLQAIAYKSGLSNSAVASGVYTIQCATPTFNPAAGTYGSAQSVTISCATSGTSIRYTTNGTTPSSTVGTVYSSAVSISVNTTLQAIAYKSGLSNSAVASGVYTITSACAAPTFNPATGTYTSSTTVTISTITGGASIRYTTNGTTPSSTVGTVYSSPVSITASCTLQAIAYENGYANSSVSSAIYTIQCAAPTFSPAAGTYAGTPSVTISTSTSGASIRYTTNGTTPSSTVGTVYSSPVTLSSNCTLQAIAYESGNANSAVTSAAYTVNYQATYTTDTTTEGSWWSSGGGYIYGSQGYVLCAWTANSAPQTGNTSDVVNLSGGYVSSVTPSNEYTWCWAINQSDTRAVINPANGNRDASSWNTSWGAGDTSFTAQVTLNNPNDGLVHTMAVYCLDWDNSGRTETLNLINPNTSQSELASPVSMSSFNNGTWVVFKFAGSVNLQINNTNANANAVISVIAFN